MNDFKPIDIKDKKVSTVKLAVAQLAEAGLLEAAPPAVEPAASMTRRDVTRRFGIAAAILLRAVVSIVAPTAAEAAASCVTDCAGQLPGTTCAGFGTCPSVNVCNCAGPTCNTGDCSDGGP